MQPSDSAGFKSFVPPAFSPARPLDKLRVAVLPLRNMSPDQADEYFAEGMTEELISTISKVGGLRVVSRTSVMSYKNTHKRLADIARELNVGTIIEGSVRKAGSRLRITVQLIDSSTDEHLWSNNYDRQLDDVFAIQSEISEQVANTLRVKLIETEKDKMLKQKTADMSAFQDYLLGKHLLATRSKDGVNKSIQLFESALKADPKFAEAYVGLAQAYELLGHHSHIPMAESCSSSKSAIEKALELDQTIADAHAILGYVFLVCDWNLEEAEGEFKKAIEFDPSNALAHRNYVRCLAAQGKLADAVVHAEIAAELDPLNAACHNERAMMYYLTGREDEAFKLWRRAQELFPNHDSLYFFTTLFLLARGELEEAEREVSHVSQQFLQEPLGMLLQGQLLAFRGRKQEALEIASRLREQVEKGHSSGDLLASVYAALGDADEFFKWAKEAVKLRHWELYVLKNHDKSFPMFRGDQRWASLLAEAGLTQHSWND